MSEQTGISYPTITLGGVEYTIKFTRGALFYRLSKAGVDLADLANSKGFATMIDVLQVVITPTFHGDAEALADLVLTEGKSLDVGEGIRAALGKAFPPTQETAAQAAGTPAAIQ